MLIPKTIIHNQNSLTLYPDRGGIITSIRFGDTELLYQGMLTDTLHDMTKSVRGGIPILFPNAGFLTDAEKKATGWNLPQHGFARTNAWKVSEPRHCEESRTMCDQREPYSRERVSAIVGRHSRGVSNLDSCSSLTQSLSSSDISDMFGYEWNGMIENNITISDEGIELKYSIANNSNKELPISFGLHPYWDIPLGDKSDIEWDFAGGDIITRDIDNWSHGGTTRIDTPDDGIVKFTIPGVGTIELRLSREFRRLWIWSLPEKNFVCVEPVMGDDGNIARDPVMIPRGGKSENWIKIILK